MRGCNEGNGEEELTFLDREVLFGDYGKHAILFDDVDLGFLGLFSGRRSEVRSWSASAANPQSDGHNGEVDGHEHSAGEIGANADEAVGLHQEVEEEALVKVLEKVVQTAERALDASSHCHFILPAFSYRLQSNGVNVVGNEAAVWT